MLKILDRIDNYWGVAEKWLLTALLLTMLGLAFTQVVMRNLFSSGIEWADVTIRHMVLWVGLLGASVAAKEKRHLSIDIASRIIPAKFYHLVEALLCLVTFSVCGLLFWASVRFTQFMYEFGTGTLEGIPALVAGLILPLAFAGVAVRFALTGMHEIADFAKKMRGEK
jgi:C4-dicarboxylate transporter, DctQ subunit